MFWGVGGRMDACSRGQSWLPALVTSVSQVWVFVITDLCNRASVYFCLLEISLNHAQLELLCFCLSMQEVLQLSSALEAVGWRGRHACLCKQLDSRSVQAWSPRPRACSASLSASRVPTGLALRPVAFSNAGCRIKPTLMQLTVLNDDLS